VTQVTILSSPLVRTEWAKLYLPTTIVVIRAEPGNLVVGANLEDCKVSGESTRANQSGILVEEAKWYALYTRPRHEKFVWQQLNGKTIESYLPLYQSVRKWNDRTALIELPLFPGYLFVHIPLAARLRVLTVAGVVRMVSAGAQPASLLDEEIRAIQTAVTLRAAEPHPYLVEGARIRIATGAFKGLEGIVVRRKGKLRAVVSIHSIMQSYAVEVDTADLVPAV
jgi:transcription antitermination factor NusG